MTTPWTASAADLRRRVEGWHAAERRERTLRKEEAVLSPGEALEAALELCELDPLEPGAVDPVRAREVARARCAWAKLRQGLGWNANVSPQR